MQLLFIYGGIELDVGNEIIKSIQIIIDKKLSNYKSDKTFISTIKRVNPNGTYVILDESGGERTVKCCIPNVTLNVRQRVLVTIFSSDLKKIYITGIA